MVAPENIVSVAAQQAIQDMVELEMYLLAQPQNTSWSLLPRSTRKSLPARKLHGNVVASRVAVELVERGFIEATSKRTYVVSKSGYHFYETVIKPNLASSREATEPMKSDSQGD